MYLTEYCKKWTIILKEYSENVESFMQFYQNTNTPDSTKTSKLLKGDYKQYFKILIIFIKII